MPLQLHLRERLHAFWESKAIYPVIAALAVAGVVLGGPFFASRPRLAPDFTLPIVHPASAPGVERLSLREQRGHVVLLDFWATWCAPCQRATPMLVRLGHRYASRGLRVVGVNVDESGPGLVPLFAQRFGVDYPLLYDSGAVMQRYGTQSLPTLLVIDKGGWIRHVHIGLDSEQTLARELEPLL